MANGQILDILEKKKNNSEPGWEMHYNVFSYPYNIRGFFFFTGEKEIKKILLEEDNGYIKHIEFKIMVKNHYI